LARRTPKVRQRAAPVLRRRAATRPKPAGSPLARARRDRGIDTRERLIAAAIDVFGHHGLEGATTRQIARAAGANLAAIVYHFGSKEGLYRAVLEAIVMEIDRRMGPVFSFMEANLPATRAEAVAVLKRVVAAFVDVLLGSPEAERWARVIVRELLDPTDAFDIIYAFQGRAHALATRIVAVAIGGDPEALPTKLLTFTIIGQGIVFRVANTLVTRRIAPATLGPGEREEIKRILAANLDAVLGRGANGAT
jgi:AcrR family transcriptional regulator